MAGLYAQVIIPRPLEATFTYHIPPALEDKVGIGFRVIVPFGPRRYLTGIIEAITPMRPGDVADIKDIDSILENTPTVIHPQIKLWRWLADYFMCTTGDVMKAALPAGLKVESKTVVELADDFDEENVKGLTATDFDIIKTLQDKTRASLKDLARIPGVDRVEHRVSALMDAGVVVVRESLVNKYRRVKVKVLRLTIPRGDNAAVTRAFDSVKRSAVQQSALMQLIALSKFNHVTEPMLTVSRDDLIEADPNITWQHIKALETKGLIAIETREVSRFSVPEGMAVTGTLPTLSPAQDKALKEIHTSFIDHNVTLLHGVTSSGKTEIYIHLIDYTLQQKRQALFLVPEIALTTQLTRRLQHVFGNKVRIYHSKFSDNERVDIWREMLANPEPCVVIGARSAVFLPFTSLGLVIVDEEHDPSYKQSDPAPRYNGRDAAIVLASFHGAKTLLGSATPSIETYYKATEGNKYGLVSLIERYGDAILPSINVVNMKKAAMQHLTNGIMAMETIAATRHTINQGGQAIFFHNRRGFSPRARCKLCQFTPKCDFCDVSLTYHKRSNTLECHYCGAVYPVPKTCPACHEPTIEIEGYGTERIEDNMAQIFPEGRIARMDLDTTRNKDAYADIIDSFSEGKSNILVGTQMVTKGLDFKNVGIVGILNADNLLNFPDFRANERSFNMMEQVAGRAGRRSDHPGSVFIQTFSPDNPVIGFVCRHDYHGFYNWEMNQRRKYLYPPMVRIINIYLKHRDRGSVERFAGAYARRLIELLGNRVKGPIEPSIERISSLYIRQIMLKIETTASIQKVKEVLRGVFLEFNASPLKSGVAIHYDVDPV